MGYPQATTDQRQQQQQQQQMMNVQGVPTAQIYSSPVGNIQNMPGRPYSSGTGQGTSPGMRQSSQPQPSYPLGVQLQTSNEQHQQQFQNRSQQQSQQSTQRCA